MLLTSWRVLAIERCSDELDGPGESEPLDRFAGGQMAAATTTETTRSVDGTTIAFERIGVGPALILVDAAGGHRELGPMRSLAGHLADDFTVIVHDRRGRGESSDTLPYSVQREVDDLAALIEVAGGTAFLYGRCWLGWSTRAVGGMRWSSSRGASASPTRSSTPWGLLSPRSRPSPTRWSTTVSSPTGLEEPSRVTIPTLVIDSQASSDDLTWWAASLAAALPQGEHRSLPGEWHGVADEVLAPVLFGFFNGG